MGVERQPGRTDPVIVAFRLSVFIIYDRLPRRPLRRTARVPRFQHCREHHRDDLRAVRPRFLFRSHSLRIDRPVLRRFVHAGADTDLGTIPLFQPRPIDGFLSRRRFRGLCDFADHDRRSSTFHRLARCADPQRRRSGARRAAGDLRAAPYTQCDSSCDRGSTSQSDPRRAEEQTGNAGHLGLFISFLGTAGPEGLAAGVFCRIGRIVRQHAAAGRQSRRRADRHHLYHQHGRQHRRRLAVRSLWAHRHDPDHVDQQPVAVFCAGLDGAVAAMAAGNHRFHSQLSRHRRLVGIFDRGHRTGAAALSRCDLFRTFGNWIQRRRLLTLGVRSGA